MSGPFGTQMASEALTDRSLAWPAKPPGSPLVSPAAERGNRGCRSGIMNLAAPPGACRSMTGGTSQKGAIPYSPSRPIEAILRLRINTGVRQETFARSCIARAPRLRSAEIPATLDDQRRRKGGKRGRPGLSPLPPGLAKSGASQFLAAFIQPLPADWARSWLGANQRQMQVSIAMACASCSVRR
jgi:hypothetical protein